jgi:hypothetical protein
LPSKDRTQHLAAQSAVFEAQLAEFGDIFFLMDKANEVFNFQQGRFYIRSDINAP